MSKATDKKASVQRTPISDDVVAYIRWLHQNTTLTMPEIAKMYNTTSASVYRFAMYEQRPHIAPKQPPDATNIPFDAIKVSIRDINENIVGKILDNFPDSLLERIADMVQARLTGSPTVSRTRSNNTNKDINPQPELPRKVSREKNKEAYKKYTIEEIAAIKWLRSNTKYSCRQIAVSIGASNTYVSEINTNPALSYIPASKNKLAEEALELLQKNHRIRNVKQKNTGKPIACVVERNVHCP